MGLFVEQKVEMGHARRDAALVYYMQTHPEDFPVTGKLSLQVSSHIMYCYGLARSH